MPPAPRRLSARTLTPTRHRGRFFYNMKLCLAFILLFCAIAGSAQIVFPKGFRRIAGERGSGLDDVYTNGRYSFQFYRESFFYDMAEGSDGYKWNDERFRGYVSGGFGFPFVTTKDSLLVGTGKIDDHYSYIVVGWGGEAYELTSDNNDAGFSTYSIWLITTMREYRRTGKLFMWPIP